MVNIRQNLLGGMMLGSSPLKVVIADDDADRVVTWQADIERVFADHGLEIDAIALAPSEFAKARMALILRAKASRQERNATQQDRRVTDEATIIDEADVFLVDSDLTPDSDTNVGAEPELVDRYLAGEIGSDVVRLARAHTTVGVTVVVNEEWKVRMFDLTLQRWSTSAADCYISVDDIANPSLWLGLRDGSFRPFGWPNLSLLARTARLEQDLELDTPISQVLGLSDNQLDIITIRQLEALAPEARHPRDVHLSHVARSPNFGVGLQPKEKFGSRELELSNAISGLRRWVDRVLLPVQNVLIDLPHMLATRPWMQPTRGDADRLNAIQGWWASDDPPLDAEAHNPLASRLLSRNVWNVAGLSPPAADDRVTSSDLAFCEDNSWFESFEDVRGFRSDIEDPFSRRYVKKLSGVEYSPRPRLSQS